MLGKAMRGVEERKRVGRRRHVVTVAPGGRAAPLEPATQTLDGAIRFWRGTLAVPWASLFQTRDDFDRTQAAAVGRPKARGAAQRLRPGQFLVTGVSAAIELLDENRRAVVGGLDLPWLGVVPLKNHLTGDTHSLLIPITFIVSQPLSRAELEQLHARQAARVASYEAEVQQCYAVLLHLTEAGGDPLYILSVLLRFARQTGTSVPAKGIVTVGAPEFEHVMAHRPGEHPLAWIRSRRAGIPGRLQARKRVEVAAPTRRRTGPAEMGPTAAMALLAGHLRATSGRPHWFNIADLFNVFAPQLRHAGVLTREHVRRRVSRVHTQQAGAWTRLAHAEDAFREALRRSARDPNFPFTRPSASF